MALAVLQGGTLHLPRPWAPIGTDPIPASLTPSGSGIPCGRDVMGAHPKSILEGDRNFGPDPRELHFH